jgi:hypothetical protein
VNLEQLRHRPPYGARVYSTERGRGQVEGVAELRASMIVYVRWQCIKHNADGEPVAWREAVVASHLILMLP